MSASAENRKDKRCACDEHEGWKDEVFKMQALPCDMLELLREESRGLHVAEGFEHLRQSATADDPEHGETAQRIERHDARRGGGAEGASFMRGGKQAAARAANGNRAASLMRAKPRKGWCGA